MFPSVLGSGSAVWNHRGLLGSWGWGPSVCRLRRGAHRTNATPGPRHWPRGDCHRCDHGDQRGPSTQGVQLIIALTTEERTETWLDTRGWTANPGWLAKWFSFSFFPFFFFLFVFLLYLFVPLVRAATYVQETHCAHITNISFYPPHIWYVCLRILTFSHTSIQDIKNDGKRNWVTLLMCWVDNTTLSSSCLGLYTHAHTHTHRKVTWCVVFYREKGS